MKEKLNKNKTMSSVTQLRPSTKRKHPDDCYPAIFIDQSGRGRRLCELPRLSLICNLVPRVLFLLSRSRERTLGRRLCTVAHNCHIKTKCSQQITKRSHQIQIAHIKFKSLTSNSNRSQQIQITHSKLQIAHCKFKSFTANSNRSQQIKVAHSKFKLLTSNYKLLTPLGVFGYLQSAVQLV